MDGLLRLHPPHFTFVVTRGEPSTLRVKFSNIYHAPIAFKVRTRLPSQYSVHPNREILLIGETREITITQAALRLPGDLRSWFDKFQILVLPLDTPELVALSKEEVWDAVDDELIVKRDFEVRLRRAHLVPCNNSASSASKNSGIKRFSRLRAKSVGNVVMEPDEIRFAVTPGVQAMTIVKVSNFYGCPLAFKAKVSNLDRYRISPNRCFIGPGQAKVLAIYLEPFETAPEGLTPVDDKILFLFGRVNDRKTRACTIDTIWSTIDECDIIHKKYVVEIELADSETEEEKTDSDFGGSRVDTASSSFSIPAFPSPPPDPTVENRLIDGPPANSMPNVPVVSSTSATSLVSAMAEPSGTTSTHVRPAPDVLPPFWDPKANEEADDATEDVVTAVKLSPNISPSFIPLSPSLAKGLATSNISEQNSTEEHPVKSLYREV